MLLSNKSSTRWVIPKGHLEEGDSGSRQRAEIEAWEEGGLKGSVSESPVGRFFYSKHGRVYQVEVFLMSEPTLADEWPERSLRTRILVSQDRALEMVLEPGLKEIIGQLTLEDKPQ